MVPPESAPYPEITRTRKSSGGTASHEQLRANSVKLSFHQLQTCRPPGSERRKLEFYHYFETQKGIYFETQDETSEPAIAITALNKVSLHCEYARSMFFFASGRPPYDSDGGLACPLQSAPGGSFDVVNLPRPGRMAGLQARTKLGRVILAAG